MDTFLMVSILAVLLIRWVYIRNRLHAIESRIFLLERATPVAATPPGSPRQEPQRPLTDVRGSEDSVRYRAATVTGALASKGAHYGSIQGNRRVRSAALRRMDHAFDFASRHRNEEDFVLVLYACENPAPVACHGQRERASTQRDNRYLFARGHVCETDPRLESQVVDQRFPVGRDGNTGRPFTRGNGADRGLRLYVDDRDCVAIRG